MDKKLVFFKEKIKNILTEYREEIGQLRYELYIELVEKTNDYEELVQMADLEMQIDMLKYIKNNIKSPLEERRVEISDIKQALNESKYKKEKEEEEKIYEENPVISELGTEEMSNLLQMALARRVLMNESNLEEMEILEQLYREDGTISSERNAIEFTYNEDGEDNFDFEEYTEDNEEDNEEENNIEFIEDEEEIEEYSIEFSEEHEESEYDFEYEDENENENDYEHGDKNEEVYDDSDKPKNSGNTYIIEAGYDYDDDTSIDFEEDEEDTLQECEESNNEIEYDYSENEDMEDYMFGEHEDELDSEYEDDEYSYDFENDEDDKADSNNNENKIDYFFDYSEENDDEEQEEININIDKNKLNNIGKTNKKDNTEAIFKDKLTQGLFINMHKIALQAEHKIERKIKEHKIGDKNNDKNG